ncbi:MAG: hypothetical protein MH208_11775 [Marinobacter sp.]|nr:hypothetical protein [Marinobacter sp.]
MPSNYHLKIFSTSPDTGELGDSFLLNLEALGVLVLLITALLLRSVYLLGLAQRRDSFCPAASFWCVARAGSALAGAGNSCAGVGVCRARRLAGPMAGGRSG